MCLKKGPQLDARAHTRCLREGQCHVILRNAIDHAGRQPADEPPYGDIRHGEARAYDMARHAVLGDQLLETAEVPAGVPLGVTGRGGRQQDSRVAV